MNIKSKLLITNCSLDSWRAYIDKPIKRLIGSCRLEIKILNFVPVVIYKYTANFFFFLNKNQ